MNMTKREYASYVSRSSPSSASLKNCAAAFLTGGFICVLGQGLGELYLYLGMDKEDSGLLASCTLILLAAILTGIGVFDAIAKWAGAGTLVPITGFANSVVAPAIDMKAEGFILGLGAKIFVISGPVILYGTLASVLYGLIYWVVSIWLR